jgi:hypothetical protein
MSNTEPLLQSGRPSSDANEEVGLLWRGPKLNDKTQKKDRWVKYGLGIWATVATISEDIFSFPSGVERRFLRLLISRQ